MHDFTSDVVAIVDDDSRVRAAMENLLGSAGFAVTSFSSAEEFLQMAGLATARCLVLDVRMPGMNGLELQRRTKHERPELPVILITGHRDDEIERRALSEGAECLLYKPVDGDQLLEAIRKAIEPAP
jgi:two-component system response regulator FixJ